ncbi:hypothetical protein MLC59_15635 [Marinobacter bryozoorum]|uniref:hypothetical protein n=1 Tax=Marinobacter bryozoorum TaxID=256324 RepID=UPI00200302F8|nr:hypothetical protein [Marinobacter bryozoorum]MCK7545598.1 hypothetical protein [Marinobacter bryozoorum]
MIRRRFWQHPASLLLGPVVWAVWFVVLYAVLSLACQQGWLVNGGDHPAVINLLLAGAGLLVALGLVTAALAAWRTPSQSDFIPRTSAMVSACSAVASLLLAVPGLIMAPCL